ncbi:DUF4261 domain-containing protein [Pelagicoccus sp. SDUM812003]|uniref:DUF4261 domain-containing protein n=1 Tax=Pelagicoccus sp. SDUM812003 TaxID=3041267 RepID=UPI00280E5A0A|nr:DUF4261 domain-containing protein [Pelagicoccus sp. SDUM812003]MDQ8205737.1 DUF4261 domain-containing protein [Pelagicoccus sp. SDUM812003]
MNLVVAMIILSSPGGPTAGELESLLPNVQEIAYTENSITYTINGVTISCGSIDAPIPVSELSGPLKTSRYWENDDDLILNSKAHLIVSASGPNDKKQLASELTHAISAILKATDSVAVYWGGATHIVPRDVFSEIADYIPEGALPLYLWIDFRMIEEEDGTVSLFTTGMKEFDLMEVEIERSRGSFEEIYDIGFNACHYVMDNGPVLGDGDTFGLSENQILKVHHQESFVDRSETVINIKME